MMDSLEALAGAHHEFASRLALLQPHQWDAPTPCAEWDVRFLVAHVIGGNRFAQRVLAGDTSESAIDHVMSSPQIGDDVVADFASTAHAQSTAFAAALRSDTVVDHPLGPLSTARFLGFRVFDVAVHAWDLAVALDVDPRLDARLVQHVLEIVNAEPTMGFGIQPLDDFASDADPQQRLLDQCGRRDR